MIRISNISRSSVRVARVAAAIFAVAVVAPQRAAAQTPPSSSSGLSTGDIAMRAKAKADSARLPYTKADIDFMAGMIGHHTQAITMCNMAPTHGASAAVGRLCERIINAQGDEITLMSNWLRDRNQAVPDGHTMPGMAMDMPGMDHEMLMPGMLTKAQMAELDSARNTDFDRKFLTFMLQHHRGATQMVRTLFETYGAAQDETIFKFANDVNVDQSTEIARMQIMLLVVPPEKKAP
jgi:uncharacterized protein (DUF305 family)